MKASHTIRPVFDDPNLVSAAGLVPAMLLAESAGLHDLLAERVSVTSPNAAVKAASVVGGMLAGADSIDDLDLLRQINKNEEDNKKLIVRGRCRIWQHFSGRSLYGNFSDSP